MAQVESIKMNVVANVELVSLMCKEASCAHNLLRKGALCCNLKHVLIAEGGKCASRQEKAE